MLPHLVNEPPATDAHPLHPCPIPVPYDVPQLSEAVVVSAASAEEAAETERFFTSALFNNPHLLIYQESEDGIRRVAPEPAAPFPMVSGPLTSFPNSTLDAAIKVRRDVSEGPADPGVPLAEALDGVARDILILPRSDRWREAVSTALLGDWMDPLFRTGHLPTTALGTLKAEARLVHRQLVPVWRRRTRHGRVLSLDAELGDGLSLYDLLAADVNLLERVTEGVFEDERLKAVLRGLTSEERRVVLARAYCGGTTWTEAAAAVAVTEPEAFGEHVRRKVRRLAAEQRRRFAQRSAGSGPFTRTR